ncbi:MAG TPA: CBS domain-containing protein [Candidatus Limnocylindria bacterium]
MNVRDVMTSEVLTVNPETPMKEVARLLAEHGVSGVPVVDDDGAVLGIISEADFVLRESGLGSERPTILDEVFGDAGAVRAESARMHAVTAGAAMSSPAITIGADRSIREAAVAMARNAVNRLPVVDKNRMVGIVSRADLVGAFLVSDEQLRTTINDDILRDTFWMEPDEVQVSVDEGVVRLSGTVDRRSTAMILARIVGQVEGVLGVRSELRWDLDDRDIEPVGDVYHEPTSASVTARERPR